MLKSVEKCGMVESIKCSGHVESSQNCDFSTFFQIFPKSMVSMMSFEIHTVSINATRSHSGEHLVAERLYAILK